MQPSVFCSFCFMVSTPSPIISSFAFLCFFLNQLNARISVIRSFSFASLPWLPITYDFSRSSSFFSVFILCISSSLHSFSGLKTSQSTPSVATVFFVFIPCHVSASARNVDGTTSRSGLRYMYLVTSFVRGYRNFLSIMLFVDIGTSSHSMLWMYVAIFFFFFFAYIIVRKPIGPIVCVNTMSAFFTSFFICFGLNLGAV